MKIIIKIALIFCLIFVLFVQFSYVYADARVEVTDGTSGSGGGNLKIPGWDTVFSDADKFIKKGSTGAEDFDIVSFKRNIDAIYNILVIIGTVLAVIIGGVLGIKFMLASAEDKAKIKEALIPYIVGCIVIFGAFGIWAFVVKILD